MKNCEESLGQPIVELGRLVKRFGSTVAVNNVSLSLYKNQVVGLIGANGSGKSTLMNLLSGNLVPDSGQLVLRGRDVQFTHSSDAIRNGISMLPQFVELYPDLSIDENIFIGQEVTFGGIFRLLDWKSMATTSVSLLREVGADIIPGQPVGVLSGGQQKAVALARVLIRNSDVLIFDEPNASLGLAQQKKTYEIIHKARSERKSIIIVTHDLDDLEAVCDRIVVMSRGSISADLAMSDLTRDDILKYMVTS